MSLRISPAHSALPVVDPATGRPTMQFFQMLQGVVNGAVPAAWEPTLAGSTTPGVYTYSLHWGVTTPIGQFEAAFFSLFVTGVTVAGAGNAEIVTLPTPANQGNSLVAGWIGGWSATLSPGYSALGATLSPSAEGVMLQQSGSGKPIIPLPISSISAGFEIFGALLYPT